MISANSFVMDTLRQLSWIAASARKEVFQAREEALLALSVKKKLYDTQVAKEI